MKLLDCSLRDGGYANEWKWPIGLAQNIVKALSGAGVDWIEIGYRRPNGDGFTYCGDKFVNKHFPGIDNLVAMIDAKDYKIKGTDVLDVPLLQKHFKEGSPISMIRVACNPDEVLVGRLATQYLTDMGYKTTINIMKMSIITDEEKKLISDIMPTLEHLEYLYFADSYGNLNSLENGFGLIEHFFPLGFHSHNNKGLSLALSMQFEGIVDSSISGIGRGAGNLDTIQILLEKNGSFSHELYVLLKQIIKIKKMAQCGYSYEYHYAGIHNIHPMYVYNLKEMHKYGSYEIIEILSRILEGKRGSCDMKYLEGLL